jgi:thymidylate kinase
MSQHSAAHEAQAQRILAYLKAHIRYDNGFLPRPFFVEFTGTPSSGKTTSIVKMYQFFRRLGFRVDKPLEGAEEIQHIPRKTPVYNIRTGLYALTMLLDESHMHNFDIIMFDRGIFDAYVWMMYWREKEKLTGPQEDFYQRFFLSPFWADTVDLAFFMVCQPEEAMRREMQFALTERLGETTNPAAIATLFDRFQRAYDLLHPHHPQLRLVDTTAMSGSEMVDHIGSTILDALERRIPKE